MTTMQITWSYEYLPYTAQDGHEIPCFRIFPIDAPEAYFAETNEHLPGDVQQRHARLVAVAPELLAAATEVVHRWDNGDLAAAVRSLAAVIASVGGAP